MKHEVQHLLHDSEPRLNSKKNWFENEHQFLE